jgi:para-nitrobenzyl esterase
LALAGPGQAQNVHIAQGELAGATADGAAIFKDIPYAAAPVGDLRWRAPQPPPRWSGARQASDFGPACIQAGAEAPHHGSQSEDCLTLNVWAPLKARDLPVMVWIHGGGFIFGTAAQYNGAAFARDGVVFVSLNYRLGRLGFFAHPALAKTSPDGDLANFGLADQIAALKWVRANIRAFGGDPRRVTIFGESAGAMSVNYLLSAPQARGLFQGAIAESGFARADGETLAAARKDGEAVAAKLGISGDGANDAAALRALPASALTATAPSILAANRIGPIIDGVIARETVTQAFANGDQAPVPAIFGGNSYEASLFPFLVDNPEPILARLGGRRDQAVALFGGGNAKTAAANMITLSQVIEPDRMQARADARRGVPAYTYYFSYLPAALRPEVIGAGHGGELAYVFDRLTKVTLHIPEGARYLGVAEIPAATPEDQAIATAMHADWVAFAKTGRPNGAGAWPAETTTSDPVMEFGVGGPTVRPDFKKLQLDVLEAVSKAGGASF